MPGILTSQPPVAQGTTGPAPSLPTDGAAVGASGFRVIISADAAQTLSGTGTVQMWAYDSNLARWARDPDLDFAVSASGVRDQASSDFNTIVHDGRVFAQVAGVGSSSGNVTPQIESY